MAINQILPFGTGAGANVLTPADYTALGARSTGFQSGVAKSKEVNTPLRQSAFVAAMIGQFIADKSGIDVLDDGDVPGLVADFLLALNAQTQSRIASTAQAQALADDTVLLTPKKLADAFKGANQSIGGSGYQKLPGRLIVQWGGVPSVAGAAAAVTFPIAFPNALVMRGAFLNDVGGATPPGGFASVAALTDIKINMGINAWYATNTRAPAGLTLWWIALGY